MPFPSYTADILTDTNSGLSGQNIVKATAASAVDCQVVIPHFTYPFDAPNKHTALFETLRAFSPA